MNALIIAACATAYAAIHSWLASQCVKDRTRRAFGKSTDRWYRLAYNLVAGVMLLPLLALLFWLPDEPLYVIPAPWLWLALLVQAAAATGSVYGIWITDGLHFLGMRQLLGGDCPAPCGSPLFSIVPCLRKGAQGDRPPLAIYGLYRWVRHPLYLLGLIFMWASSRMTINTTTLFAVFSIYLYVGTFFEEERLIAEHGEAYRKYQRQVPRLFPWRGPVRVRLPAPPLRVQ